MRDIGMMITALGGLPLGVSLTVAYRAGKGDSGWGLLLAWLLAVLAVAMTAAGQYVVTTSS